MGEIADDMIDGLSCSLCGQFFIDGTEQNGEQQLYEHGYTAVCWNCWRNLSKKEKKIHQRAERPTL